MRIQTEQNYEFIFLIILTWLHAFFYAIWRSFFGEELLTEEFEIDICRFSIFQCQTP